MYNPIKWFIGYDSSQASAYFTCEATLARYVDRRQIFGVNKSFLERRGWFWGDHGGSTEFSQTRWLTPFLAGYYGTAVFMDCDFLWRHDPRGMLEYHDSRYAVTVVKHDLRPVDLSPIKMNGKEQVWYPKKNWSSLMVFNAGHKDCRALDPELISNNPEHAGYFHQFHWTDAVNPTSIPTTYNNLVGYRGYDNPDPVGVHFTDGGPWLGGEYENQPFADEYFEEKKKALAMADVYV